MQTRIPRRELLTGIGALAATACLPLEAITARELLYPHRDLSYFDTPISPAPSEIHWGYAAITWGGNDRQAIDDISSLGLAVPRPCSTCSTNIN
jgi:hypothetical protein